MTTIHGLRTIPLDLAGNIARVRERLAELGGL